jgi:hypothetical protein
MVKFNRYNVTNGTHKARIRYSLDNRADGRKCVTLYSKDYSSNLRYVMEPTGGDCYRNDTDSQTDYFDKGRAVLFESHPLYAAARARAEAIRAINPAEAY